ncbi:MAG: sugar phosphate nucleotidyltransferase [Longimicrobiales bacterium]|nr:sugar phosphate nucleotidyltransferase [Longimicrobiales bacterium]
MAARRDPTRGPARLTMDGMILAAGLGTRLRPLTDETPKALIRVGGVPMLERVARRLIAAGVDRLIVNVHHHADQVIEFIGRRDGFGVETRISREPARPLETGGGLLHAREHFREDGPFLLHNVDVICDADLGAMVMAHRAAEAGPGSGAVPGTPVLATLAVQDRAAKRFLRFDDHGLQARIDQRDGSVDTARPVHGETRDRAFAGIHVISPRIFHLMTEDGFFSIIEPYLRLAGEGYRILPHDVTGALWLEVGDPDRLERARRFLRRSNGDEERA